MTKKTTADLDTHSSMSDDREQASTVDKEVLCESLGAYALENNVVSFQRLQVHATGQGWMKALCQPLADRHLLGDYWVP